MILLVASAWALTLEETVARAREVNPYAVAAELEWRRVRLEAAEAWTLPVVSPEVTVERRWGGGATIDEGEVQVSTGILDVPAWFDALEQSAQARSLRWQWEGTALDAQYAAAVLYVEALAAEDLLEAARRSVAEAEATLAGTRGREDVGIDSAITVRSAEVQALEARAGLREAEATARNARARLARAIERDVDTLAPARLEPPPSEAPPSPWIEAQREVTTAARMEHVQSWTELLPTAELQADAPIGTDAWTVALQATWTVDGPGPLLRARASALAVRQSETLVRGLELDRKLAVEVGQEDARARAEVAESARAREALAAEALAVGQARLAVGLVDTLDVVQLQDDVADARVDRIEAELEEAYAILEARRLAGVPW